jgi:ADP-heptose:LPS heptosyltransferase
MAGIRRRVGHATEGRGFLLTESLRYDPDRFEADCYLDLAAAAGIDVSEAPAPNLYISDEERAVGREMLQGATVAVQPGARYAEKQIPLDCMVEVVSALQQKGGTVAMVGGADEVVAGQALLSHLDRPVVDLIGKCSIRQTLGVLANLRAAIGSDTGLMHLAAGVGCPTITVFGPNSPEKWGHQRPPHRVLLAPGGNMAEVSAHEILAEAEAILNGP